MKGGKLGERGQVGVELQKWKDLDKPEERERAHREGPQCERRRFYGDEVLLGSSVTLDRRSCSRLELDSKVNGKPLDASHDTIRSALARRMAWKEIRRDAERHRGGWM